MTTDPAQAQRLEAILHQLTALPTLSPIAVRLLELTADDDAEAPEVVQLVESDPALTSKVLKLCRRSSRGRASQVKTVERAVLLLGFQAVRSAVLSVQVFDLFDQITSPGGEAYRPHHAFDRIAFWHHSLGVAALSQAIAQLDQFKETVHPGQAFIAGLLHDLGLLTLHVMLPESLDKVCLLAERQGITLDDACRRCIGIDSHTIGKRLAEHWRLPRPIADVMWLHGQRPELLPDMPHRDLISVVTVADVVARHRYVGPPGHGPRDEPIESICKEIGLEGEQLDFLITTLHETVSERVAALGLDEDDSAEVLLRSLSRANGVLGRMNEHAQKRAGLADQQRGLLESIADFHANPGENGSVVGVLSRLVRSSNTLLSGGFFAAAYQLVPDDVWQLVEIASDGRVVGHRIVTDIDSVVALGDVAANNQHFVPASSLMGTIRSAPNIAETPQIRAVGLDCGWGVSAVLLVAAPELESWPSECVEPILRTWSAALAAAAQHESTKRLTEQLAEANHTLTVTQHELARQAALASVGEIAAGAAHEMNNPLTVISGRSQLLARSIEDQSLRETAEQIVEQSHRLSNLITALNRFASPAEPRIAPSDVAQLVQRAVDASTDGSQITVSVDVADDVPIVPVDQGQVRDALEALLRNAVESDGTRRIAVCVQIDPVDGRLVFRITDDGSGLSEHALAHAFDPFFSDKPAGRQPGLGLAQARRIVEAHGGRIELKNGDGGGAEAIMRLDVLPREETPARHVA